MGDEGGFAPNLGSNEEALGLIEEAIAKAGYKPGKDVFLGVDCAANEFYKDGKYVIDGAKKTGPQLVDYYAGLVERHPIVTIEDGFDESDWTNWGLMTEKLSRQDPAGGRRHLRHQPGHPGARHQGARGQRRS